LSSVTHIWVQKPALIIPSVSSYTGEGYIDVPLAATFSNFTGKFLFWKDINYTEQCDSVPTVDRAVSMP
jgi:hypothetical protein